MDKKLITIFKHIYDMSLNLSEDNWIIQLSETHTKYKDFNNLLELLSEYREEYYSWAMENAHYDN